MSYVYDGDPTMQTGNGNTDEESHHPQSPGKLLRLVRGVLSALRRENDETDDGPDLLQLVAQYIQESGIAQQVIESSLSDGNTPAIGSGAPLTPQRERELDAMRKQLGSGQDEIVIEPKQ